MAQTFSWDFNELFAKQFKNLSKKDQDSILDFTDIFEKHGLSDFTKYTGKISPSWSGLDTEDEEQKAKFDYAKHHKLWHYHVGLPVYVQVHGKYQTSDWVLHFQWENGSDELYIADMCYHYTEDGKFYLPTENYLKKAG